MKEKKLEKLIWPLFALVGTIFLIIGIVSFKYIFDYSNKVDTQGTITRIVSDFDDDYDVYVSYRVDGKTYNSRLNYYSSSFYEGKKINIYYDKDNPNKIGSKSRNLIFLVFPLLGLIFFIIGLVGIIFKHKKKKMFKELKKNGRLIYANYVQITLNETLTVNGKHPYNIICEWKSPENNKVYIFKSENIWINPDIIMNNNITKIPVYINETVDKYYVDVESITANIIDLR